jgi:transcriptional regulator with XRE-family HTH domain
MAIASSPTVRRLELGHRLRGLRLAANKTPEDAAKELMCSLAKISRAETGQRGVPARDVRDLCRFYGASDDERDELMSLADLAGERGWWQDFRGLDEQTQTYIGLESAATELLQFEALRITGLLQLEDYARLLVPQMRPPGFWDEGITDQIVEARRRRQQRVSDGQLQLSVVMDAAAFVHPVSSQHVMIAQLAHLLKTADLPNVSLQIIDFGTPPHPGLDGAFQLLRLPNQLLKDTVFVEGQFGNQFFDKEDIVQRYHDVYRHLSSAVALSTDDTLAWLHRHHEQLKTEAERGRRAGNTARPERSAH